MWEQPQIVERTGVLLSREWNRAVGPRGQGDKALVDVEIEDILRPALLINLLGCDFWGEETGHSLTGQARCWVEDPNDGTSDFLKGQVHYQKPFTISYLTKVIGKSES